MRGLTGKRALITGGAGAIGSATARRFLEEGSRVAILDNNQEGLLDTDRDLEDLELTLLADVADDKSVALAFEQIDSLWGGLDILINNAGVSYRSAFIDITPEEWQSVIEINLNGAFLVAQLAAQRMLEADGGVIINMGSTNGLMGYHYYAHYNASKAGLIELGRSMALELGPMVRVNTICPGFILTPMQEAEYTAEMRRAFESKLPLRRLGRPEDVAALFAFLASDDASFITGEHIVIDGGEIAGGLASQP